MESIKINLIASVGNLDEIEAQIESLQSKLNSLKVEIKAEEHDEITTDKTFQGKIRELQSSLPRANRLLDIHKPSDYVLDEMIPTIIKELNSDLYAKHGIIHTTEGDRLYVRNFFQRNGYKVKFTTEIGTLIPVGYIEVSVI